MIKVTVKEVATNDKGGYETRLVVKDHKDATWAMVYNGVLSLFPDSAPSNDFVGKSIAGYEPSAWQCWEKA